MFLQNNYGLVMKRVVIPGFMFFISILSGHAQTLISGRVKDLKNKPIPGASISVKNSFDGATSDSSGNYSFSSSDTGLQTLTVSSIGYRPIEITLHITGNSIHMDMQLKEEPNELKAVTISAGSFSAGDKTRGAVMSSLDIATTAGSNADITAALKTLPGAQQVGEQEGLFVRGGTRSQSNS